jgi:hypothetical protein
MYHRRFRQNWFPVQKRRKQWTLTQNPLLRQEFLYDLLKICVCGPREYTPSSVYGFLPLKRSILHHEFPFPRMFTPLDALTFMYY